MHQICVGFACSLLFSSLAALQAQRAQPSAELIDKALVERALGVRQATIQDLALPANERRDIRVRITLDGRARILELRPHSVLSKDFKLIADDGKQLTTLSTPREVTYQGEVSGEQDSVVGAALIEGQLTAYIAIGKKSWSVQPVTSVASAAAKTAHASYRHEDILATDVRCGQGSSLQSKIGSTGPTSLVLREAEIALDCNNEYYKRFASSTTRTFAAATARMNQVDVIYRREVEICYRIPTILIRTTKVYQNGPAVGCVSGPDLLDDMRVRWRAQHSGIHRDIAHMFSGWGTWSGIIGCASVSVVCSQTGAFGVSRVVNSNEGRNTGLVAHELGHNWSSGHCNSAAPCYIMCSGLGGCARDLTRFSAFAKTRIAAHKNSRNCLSTCCPDATYTYFGAGCKGSGSGGGIPLLAATSGPKLGGSLAVRVSNAKSNGVAALMHGASKVALDLAAAGAPGCLLYVNNVFYTSAALANGSGVADFPQLDIPNLSALCGIRFFHQVLVVDSANPLGLVFSRRGEPVVGS